MATSAVMPYRDISVSFGDVLKSLNPFSSSSLWSNGNDAGAPAGPSIPNLALALSDAFFITRPSGTPEQNAQQRANDNSQIQNAFFDLPGLGEIAPPIDPHQADALATASTFGSAPGLTDEQNRTNRDYVRNYIDQQNKAMNNNIFTGMFDDTIFGGDPTKASFPWILVILAVVVVVVLEMVN